MRLKRKRVHYVMDICSDNVDTGQQLKMGRTCENFKKHF